MRFVLDEATCNARKWMAFANSPDDTVRQHMARIDRLLDAILAAHEALCQEADGELAISRSYGNRLCLARMLYQLAWQICNLSAALVTLRCSYPNDISDDDLRVSETPTFLTFDPLEPGYRQRIAALQDSGVLSAAELDRLRYQAGVLEDGLTLQSAGLTLTKQERGDLHYAEETIRTLETRVTSTIRFLTKE